LSLQIDYFVGRISYINSTPDATNRRAIPDGSLPAKVIY
jgi:hypothetical protein